MKKILLLSSVLLVGLVVALSQSFIADVIHAQVVTGRHMFNGASTAALQANTICAPNGGVCNSTLTTLIGAKIPFALTIKNLYATQTTAPATGSSCAYTIRQSTNCTAAYTSTTLTCTITGNGSNTSCTNTAASVSVPAGACLQVMFAKSGTCAGYGNWGFEGDY